MKKILDILIEKKIHGWGDRWGTDKASDHSYDNLYDNVFSSYKDKEIRLMELGIQYGGSSLLWHEFFPKAKLVLVDILDQVQEKLWDEMDKNRYDYHIMDAFTKESTNKINELYPEGFDIIIEDGPHTLESQIFAIQNYTPLLKEGGILIIEDIQQYDDCKLIIESIGEIPHKSCEIVDLRGIKGRYDDILIVVKK
jgi:cephalosporin hydroxylase